MRKKINYKGRVQGVGFRWNTEKAVQSLNVTGYVKNLPNGSVELLLEGNSGEVLKAEKAIEERMRGYWTEKESYELPGDDHWQEFKIHY
ncbi:MAG: hypothetical protein CMI28_02595 [Opitutae bacterium]|nr:hypothetical protein [Opitutae bacterium]HAD20484.1 hypothetical protein [Opitutae bacterium]|tara:strand:- start:87 stop:353 length:267 start_codon:yes stop_codon:yes gene_type:complete